MLGSSETLTRFHFIPLSLSHRCYASMVLSVIISHSVILLLYPQRNHYLIIYDVT